MAFLTKSNANRVIGSANLLAMNLSGILYKKPIYFFNILEYKKLLAYYTLYNNPSDFVAKYIPAKIEDKLQFIWEGGKPAYHSTITCERVHSDFKNIKIPSKIRESGEEAVLEFREWFKQTDITNLFHNDEGAFMMRMHSKFIKYLPGMPERVKYDNSGQEHFDNISLSELETNIDRLLNEAAELVRNANMVTRKIIVHYDKHTCYASKGMPFPNDLPEPKDLISIDEERIRKFLVEYEKRYKIPVFNHLRHYYRMKFNPELKFEGILLEQLGFRKCGACP